MHIVTFVNWQGTVIKTQQVGDGEAAEAPKPDPTRPGYKFIGWDLDFSNVTSNLTVTAQYTEMDGGSDTADTKDVRAKIIGERVTMYVVDIEWGELKFVYDAAGNTWDPDTHTYIDGTGEPSWLVNNAAKNNGTATEWYLEKGGSVIGNNEIIVTNHSNGAVDADFNYSMHTGAAVSASIAGDATAFNADSVVTHAVAGGFYASEGDAQAGALLFKDSVGFNTLPNGRISLPTAEGRPVNSIELRNSVYFAFSGKPDAGRMVVLPEFKTVGSITVSISPNYDPVLNTPGS